jgi:hypothetical protein
MEIFYEALEKGRAAKAQEDITELLVRAKNLRMVVKRNSEKIQELIFVALRLAARGKYGEAALCMGPASSALWFHRDVQASANELAQETALKWGTFIDHAVEKEGLSPKFRDALIIKSAGNAPEGSPLALQARLKHTNFVAAGGTGQGEQSALPSAEAAPVSPSANAKPLKTLRDLRAIERPPPEEVIRPDVVRVGRDDKSPGAERFDPPSSTNADLIPPLLANHVVRIPPEAPTFRATSLQRPVDEKPGAAIPPVIERAVAPELTASPPRRGTIEISEYVAPVSPPPPQEKTPIIARLSSGIRNRMKAAGEWASNRASNFRTNTARVGAADNAIPKFVPTVNSSEYHAAKVAKRAETIRKMKVAAKWVVTRGTSAGAGAALRHYGGLALAHAAVAGTVATSAPILVGAAAFVAAAAFGITAGGLGNILATKLWGTAEEKQGNWMRAAFAKDMKSKKSIAISAISGLIGFGVMDYKEGGTILKHLYSPLKDLFFTTAPIAVVSHDVAQSAAQSVVHSAAQSAAHAAHSTIFHPFPDKAPFGADKILSDEDIARHHISPKLVKMLSSNDPETLMKGLGQVAYKLQNTAPYNPAKALEAIRCSLHIYDRTDPHTWLMEHMVKKAQDLHAQALQSASAHVAVSHDVPAQMRAEHIGHTKLMDGMAKIDHANAAYRNYQLFEKVKMAVAKAQLGDNSGMEWVKHTFGAQTPVNEIRAQLRQSAIDQARLSGRAVHNYGERLLHLLKADAPKPTAIPKLSAVPKITSLMPKPSVAANLSWMSKPPLALAA